MLDEVENDYVKKAQNDGRICVGVTCENIPEPLVNLDGVFSLRMRAPRTGSLDISTYYMTNFLCEYSRAILERAIEGGYNFMDAVITPDGCTMMNRSVENMELLKTNRKEKYFNSFMEIPMKADDNGLNLYVLQCKNHILKPLNEVYGIDVSDVAMRTSVEQHNIMSDLNNAIC